MSSLWLNKTVAGKAFQCYIATLIRIIFPICRVPSAKYHRNTPVVKNVSLDSSHSIGEQRWQVPHERLLRGKKPNYHNLRALVGYLSKGPENQELILNVWCHKRGNTQDWALWASLGITSTGRKDQNENQAVIYKEAGIFTVGKKG